MSHFCSLLTSITWPYYNLTPSSCTSVIYSIYLVASSDENVTRSISSVEYELKSNLLGIDNWICVYSLTFWHCYFCHLESFEIFILNCDNFNNDRLHNEVTVDIFACRSVVQAQHTALSLPTEKLQHFDLWPFSGRSHDKVTVDAFSSLSMPIRLHCYFCYLK